MANVIAKKKLYAVPDEYRKVMYQPNHIVHAQYNYTLIQERIFNYIIFWLQTYVSKVMNGTILTQLDIFGEQNKDYIDIEIPLCLIGKPYQYQEIRARAIEMMSIMVHVDVKKLHSKEIMERVQNMITHVDIPKAEKRRSGTLPIRISKEVSMLMLKIDRDNGTPINYTSFLFNVALQAENKYTSRIYKLLSSYKRPPGVDGFYYVKYERFREILQVGNKYRDYEAFKRCIILPVQQELKDNADIYFEISETREANKKVDRLNFIIRRQQDEDSILTECKLWNSIEKRLIEWFDCDKAGVVSILDALKAKIPARTVQEKITYLMGNYLERMHTANAVRNKSSFAIGSLKREYL